MSYVDRIIERDERVVVRARTNKLALAVSGGLSVLALIVELAVSGFKSFAVMQFLIGLVTVLVIMAPTLIAVFTTELVLTDRRVIGKIGWINIRTIDLPVDRIHAVSLYKMLFGRVFGYTTICLSTASVLGVFLHRIIQAEDAEAFRAAVSQQMRRVPVPDPRMYDGRELDPRRVDSGAFRRDGRETDYRGARAERDDYDYGYDGTIRLDRDAADRARAERGADRGHGKPEVYISKPGAGSGGGRDDRSGKNPFNVATDR